MLFDGTVLHIVRHLAELFCQILYYSAELFRQIAFHNKFSLISDCLPSIAESTQTGLITMRPQPNCFNVVVFRGHKSIIQASLGGALTRNVNIAYLFMGGWGSRGKMVM